MQKIKDGRGKIVSVNERETVTEKEEIAWEGRDAGERYTKYWQNLEMRGKRAPKEILKLCSIFLIYFFFS